MRTEQEIAQEIEKSSAALNHDEEYIHDMDRAATEGQIAGFETGLKLMREGKTPLEIAQYALSCERSYVAYGNDKEDAWQSGYTVALEWVGEQFDWTENDVIFRAGNLRGMQ